MQIDENWYKLYEKLYGKHFNRLLTTGNISTGYVNYNVHNLDDIRDFVEDGFPKNEFYISLYNYETEDNILRWDSSDLSIYETYAQKNCIIFRFKQNTDIIKEEVIDLNEIQKFMFIRRSINLGCNKDIVEECNKTYNFFKAHFNIKGIMMFNGFDECLLYYYTNELSLKNSSLTLYNINKVLKEKLELKTILFENIEPYAQITPLPGTQNNNTRLYTQLYFPDFTYEQIMLKGQEKLLDEDYLYDFETSEKLEEFIKDMDDEITNTERSNTYNFDEIWDKI